MRKTGSIISSYFGIAIGRLDHLVFRLHTRKFFPASLFGGGVRFVVRAFNVQGEKVFEDLLVRYVEVEAVRGADSGVEFPMRVREPSWTFIVEICQRAFRQPLRALVIARFDAQITNGA